jgi:hydrogenase maturation protein HypF
MKSSATSGSSSGSSDMRDISGACISVRGVVQGVGFRPFIHRLARRHELNGFVANTTSGVLIEVEGDPEHIRTFYRDIEKNAPPFAQIQSKSIHPQPPENFDGFTIRTSLHEARRLTFIAPDIGICNDCLRELLNPSDRRYGYPFINCTNCGPRFTIIERLPYDRSRTTMKDFTMCEACAAEYADINDRRYHAQPNACALCGPSVELLPCGMKSPRRHSSLPHREETCRGHDAILASITYLKQGKILAIKGLGGFHLACDATNDDAVNTLKSRKKRERDKPLAVMFPALDTVKEFCTPGEEEALLLQSPQRPIVLLEKRPDCSISAHVSPNNRYLGVMLPYTPLHYLLFFADRASSGAEGQVTKTMSGNGIPTGLNHRYDYPALVMTSANTSDEPIVKDNDEAFERLSSIADYILIHDRPILNRCDDSVVRISKGKTSFIRRSRGYTPFPVVLDFHLETILGCGAEQKHTFCLTLENYAFLSQHIGDLKNRETFVHFRESLDHFKQNFNAAPSVIACDLHPDYLSTRFARDCVDSCLDGDMERLFPVQHHHAHIASCMAENGLNEKVIGVSYDGTGYGADGQIWGGEFLLCDYGHYIRAGHLEYVPLPGGEAAIREPWRMAVSYLHRVFGIAFREMKLPFLTGIPEHRIDTLLGMIEKGINTRQTSSLGRLFDAVSAVILSRNAVTYEGQGAVELEQAIEKIIDDTYHCDTVERDGTILIDTPSLFAEVVRDVQKKTDPAIISCKFHNTVVQFTVDTCISLSKKTGITSVALSGGCFQNMFLSERVAAGIEDRGLQCYIHTKVPPNDGGISLGQVLVASERSAHVRGDSGEGDKNL